MITVRLATDRDVEALRDLFMSRYGEDYPYPEFYDTEWLKRSVYDDKTLVVVAETDGAIVATGSVVLNAGDYDDLVAEIGRMVTARSPQAKGAAKAIVADLMQRMERRTMFAYAEVRTVHERAQALIESFGWRPVGFEPLKYQLAERESMVIYANLQPMSLELRRNNPRVIPEAAPLAQTALKSLGLPVDAIVDDEAEGYPTSRTFETERLREQGVTPILRIERGRVSNREVFGNFSLAHGFFSIADTDTHYVVARDGEAVLGAIGFTWDPIDSKVRVFELIEFNDAVKGFLLAEVDRLARDEFGAVYQEMDVSAYAPKVQRTLERLGFVPVAYCPSMVFSHVERLDVIRMAKLNLPYDPGTVKLLAGPQRIKSIVETGFEDRSVGMEITGHVRQAELFYGLPDGDLYHLSRICKLRTHEVGTVLIHEGDPADRLFQLVDGRAEARSGDRVLGVLGADALFGEMALVESAPRSADVVITEEARVIQIEIDQLERLMDRQPRLGHLVMRNLARGLSEKLRALR